MPEKRFHTILLDADGTLFDFVKAERTAIKNTSFRFGIEVSEEDVNLYNRINNMCWMKLERGEITREELFTERFSLWFSHIGASVDPLCFHSVYENNLSMCGFLYEGVYEFLKALKESYRLILVTNGSAKVQRGRLKESGISSYFSNIYISEEIGLKKPDAEFFDYVMNDAGIEDRSGVVIFGDSLSSDMQGGRNAGIATCKYSPDGRVGNSELCDHEAESFENFLNILDISL